MLNLLGFCFLLSWILFPLPQVFLEDFLQCWEETKAQKKAGKLTFKKKDTAMFWVPSIRPPLLYPKKSRFFWRAAKKIRKGEACCTTENENQKNYWEFSLRSSLSQNETSVYGTGSVMLWILLKTRDAILHHTTREHASKGKGLWEVKGCHMHWVS